MLRPFGVISAIFSARSATGFARDTDTTSSESACRSASSLLPPPSDCSAPRSPPKFPRSSPDIPGRSRPSPWLRWPDRSRSAQRSSQTRSSHNLYIFELCQTFRGNFQAKGPVRFLLLAGSMPKIIPATGILSVRFLRASLVIPVTAVSAGSRKSAFRLGLCLLRALCAPPSANSVLIPFLSRCTKNSIPTSAPTLPHPRKCNSGISPIATHKTARAHPPPISAHKTSSAYSPRPPTAPPHSFAAPPPTARSESPAAPIPSSHLQINLPLARLHRQPTPRPLFRSARAFADFNGAAVNTSKSSSAVSTIRAFTGSRSFVSTITRNNFRRRFNPLRSVSNGSSARIVPIPVSSASDACRIRCTSARASSPVIHTRFFSFFDCATPTAHPASMPISVSRTACAK